MPKRNKRWISCNAWLTDVCKSHSVISTMIAPHGCLGAGSPESPALVTWAHVPYVSFAAPHPHHTHYDATARMLATWHTHMRGQTHTHTHQAPACGTHLWKHKSQHKPEPHNAMRRCVSRNTPRNKDAPSLKPRTPWRAPCAPCPVPRRRAPPGAAKRRQAVPSAAGCHRAPPGTTGRRRVLPGATRRHRA